jgi:hypothetical protein
MTNNGQPDALVDGLVITVDAETKNAETKNAETKNAETKSAGKWEKVHLFGVENDKLGYIKTLEALIKDLRTLAKSTLAKKKKKKFGDRVNILLKSVEAIRDWYHKERETKDGKKFTALEILNFKSFTQVHVGRFYEEFEPSLYNNFVKSEADFMKVLETISSDSYDSFDIRSYLFQVR